jgi:cardiolipin synthase
MRPSIALSILASVSLPLVTACPAAGTAAGDDDPLPDAAVTPDSPPMGADFCNATDPRDLAVVVSPTPESGEQPYLDVLAQAQTKIRVEIYLMGYGGILDSLKAKAGAGVDVEIILDQSNKDTNQKYYDALAAAGAHVKWSSPGFTYQHAKFIVADDKAAIMSTGNFSKSYSIDLERNFAATDRDPADIADLVALFDADWNGVAPAMTCTRMIISPINARQRIFDLIDSAQTTLTIESMQFADYKVRDHVKARIQAGVAVRVMLADANWISANTAGAQFLKDLGVTVKWIPHLHTKAIVADGVRAYIGSENLSQTSLDKNREVGVVVVEASSVAPIVATFEKDWGVGTPF